MEENLNIQSENNDSLISLLWTSKIINNKKFLYLIWFLFILVLWLSAFIIYLQFNLSFYDWKKFEFETWLLELILTTLGILFAISFLSNEWKEKIFIDNFIDFFYENFEFDKKYTNFEFVKKWRYSSYKNLVKFKHNEYEIFIWFYLPGKEFYIYSDNKEILENFKKNWAEETSPKNVFLWKKEFTSYKELFKEINTYMNFIEENLK